MVYFREKYLKKIRQYYDVDLVKVITGPRGSGKSKILSSIILELSNKTSTDNIISIDMEHINITQEIYDYISLNNYIETKITSDDKHYIFIDEIQRIDKFEKTIVSLKNKFNCSIFITFSNSTLLSGELATLLDGRTIEFVIYPFSYAETLDFLKFLGKEIPNDFFDNYLIWGGFPQRFELLDFSESSNYLNGVYSKIINTDIAFAKNTINMSKFNAIAPYLLVSSGNDFSANNIASYYNNTNNYKTRDAITDKTITKYLNVMEKSYIISKVPRYDVAGKKILKQTNKFYSIDNGFRTINTNFFDISRGFWLENLVYIELKSRGYKIFIGKTKNSEVDFIVIKGNSKCYIQVAYYLIENTTIQRELGSLLSIKDQYNKYLISLDKIFNLDNGIKHINIVEFLLNEDLLKF